jgi:hypothetical protein
MRRWVGTITGLVVAAGALALAASATAQGWSVFKSDRFGFAMLVAPGTRWEAQDFGGGWGGIRAKKGVLEFVGIVKLDYAAPPKELGEAAVMLTRVPQAAWRQVDKGRNNAGWNWWQTYEARNSNTGRVLFTVLGTGRRGSYILFLETSQADFAANRALYDQWYRSLTLY